MKIPIEITWMFRATSMFIELKFSRVGGSWKWKRKCFSLTGRVFTLQGSILHHNRGKSVSSHLSKCSSLNDQAYFVKSFEITESYATAPQNPTQSESMISKEIQTYSVYWCNFFFLFPEAQMSQKCDALKSKNLSFEVTVSLWKLFETKF